MEQVPDNHKDNNTPAYTTQSRVLLFVVVAVIAFGGVVLYWREHPNETPNCPDSMGSREIGVSSNLGAYYNQRFGFSFAIPSGYRLATDLMQFLNVSSAYPIASWSPENTEEVVVTGSNKLQEQAFVQSATDGEKSINFTNVTGLPRSTYIVVLNLDQKTVQSDLSVPYQHVLVSGLQAIRYTDLANEEVVAVPYDGRAKLANGDPARTIFIKMSNATDSFDPSAFGAVIASFCYVRS